MDLKAGLRHAFSMCAYCMRLRFQSNYFENPTACSKRTLKTRVAMQLKPHQKTHFEKFSLFEISIKNVEIQSHIVFGYKAAFFHHLTRLH
jgi:hypothetical protein